MCVHSWHHKKYLNIPVTCLRGTCLVWHHAWLFHAWLYHMLLFLACLFTVYTSLNDNQFSIRVAIMRTKRVATHELDTHTNKISYEIHNLQNPAITVKGACAENE